MHRVTALTLLKYKRWIDAGMLCAIAATDARCYAAERRKMLRLMHHVHVTDMIVRANLTGAEPPYSGVHAGRVPEAAALMLSMHACSNWYVEHASALPPGAWDRVMTYRRTDGKMMQASTLALVEQVILHGTRHRGAVSWLINACGGAAPQDVVSGFLRESLRDIR